VSRRAEAEARQKKRVGQGKGLRATWLAGHLQLHGARLRVAEGSQSALPTLGTGGAPAVLTEHLRTHRDAILHGDALLILGTAPALTSRQAGGSVQPITTKGALGTALGMAHFTGTTTPPTTAAKSPHAGALRGSASQDTSLALLPPSRLDAHTHQRPLVQGA
jgi:hypothetical protein